MIYVVSGHNRTGTHMMLNAIHAGSKLRLVRDGSLEKKIRKREVSKDYNPNPVGYHLPPAGFTPQENDLYKWPQAGLEHLPEIPGQEFLVICMQRDPEEMHASMNRAFGSDVPEWQLEDGKRALHIARARPDVTVHVISYASVVEEPEANFEQLQSWGWPINPDACAQTIDPKLYRNRKL